jgi:chromosomal replication initiator protein
MQIWEKVSSELSKTTDSMLSIAILDKIEFKGMEANKVILSAPDHLTAGWFRETFLDNAKIIASKLFNKDFSFSIEVPLQSKEAGFADLGRVASKSNNYRGEAMQVWEKIYRELSKAYDTQLNSAILDKIEFKEIVNNDTIVLVAPDQLTAGWFRENFLSNAKTIAYNLFQKEFKFEIHVAFSQQSYETVSKKSRETREYYANPFAVKLDPKFTFEHFVVGPNNDFANAAALNVASNPGKTYNPLFIYGNVALGKTHLLQAIAHKIMKEKPELKVLYVTSEEFTNEFIEKVIRNREAVKFKKKYRNVDVLLIDDVQFFQNKSDTLNELFHTFNKLAQERKQMVFACDRPPKSLSAIEDRLLTRFDSGLTVEIHPPSFETRKAILLDRTEQEKINIPNSVIEYIAKNIESDIRMLEGALTKLIAYSDLQKKSISMNLAKEILRDKIKIEMPQNVTPKEIQKVVSKYFGLSVNDLVSNKRMESVSYPRQIAMYITKEFTNLSLTEIGQLFGGKAHTTVMRSYQKISSMIKRKKVKKEVDDIIASFYDK